MTTQTLKVLRNFLDDPGHQLSGAQICKVTGMSSGTVYPILIRLEEQGILHSKWEEGNPELLGRPRRRFYRISETGLLAVGAALEELRVVAVLQSVLQG
jgi:PadR family transcriptional regulator PadR